MLADNKLVLGAGWDKEILAIELQGLVDLAFDAKLTEFGLAKIDLVLNGAGEADDHEPLSADHRMDVILGLTGE